MEAMQYVRMTMQTFTYFCDLDKHLEENFQKARTLCLLGLELHSTLWRRYETPPYMNGWNYIRYCNVRWKTSLFYRTEPRKELKPICRVEKPKTVPSTDKASDIVGY